MPGAHRLGDLSQVQGGDAHGCTGCPHPAVGPGIVGSPNVNINNMPARRKGDAGIHAACCGPNMYTANAGSGTVNINGMPAHREGDATKHCGGVGQAGKGSADVIIGG